MSRSRTPSSSRRRPRASVFVHAQVGRVHVPYLKSKLRECVKLARSPLQELSVALVGDRSMGSLHEQFMGLRGPTDVLTFPLEHDARGRVIGGEVVVCVPEARRRAADHGTELKHELLLYALHGVLHLNGMDDRTGPQYRRMHRLEDSILRRLGIGPVFDPPRPPQKLTRQRAGKTTAKGRQRR